MRSLAEHLQLVMSRVRPLEPLALPLLDANGCVLAVDVTAPADVPAFHTSAVSGYAARAGDIAMASPALSPGDAGTAARIRAWPQDAWLP
ncbi:MAG: hypothetical protein V9G10_08465 [Candidatus Nanopelagicales bacterium]